MPRSKFDKPRFPEIDKLRACILDRKMSMKKNWSDEEKLVGFSFGGECVGRISPAASTNNSLRSVEPTDSRGPVSIPRNPNQGRGSRLI